MVFVLIEVTQLPRLKDPVLVLALSGWVDAGFAGAGTAEYLVDHGDAMQVFGRADLSEVMDLQRMRPKVQFVDGQAGDSTERWDREIVWPMITLAAGKAGHDLVVVQGPEPAHCWQQLAAELVELIQRLKVGLMVSVGGMPAAVSRHRPVRVLATATSRGVAERVGALRPDYQGPTGAQTAIQVACGSADIDAVGLWAQVPHYLAASSSPVAVRAVLERLRDIAQVNVDLRPLDAQIEAYSEGVEEQLATRPDLAAMVESIEVQDPQDELPTGEDLASEIEEFLRNRDE